KDNPYTPLVYFASHSADELKSDVLIQVEGFWQGEATMAPYPMDTETTAPDEQVEQDLSAASVSTVAMCLHLTDSSPDWSYSDVDTDIVLATVYGDDDNYVQINADLVNDEIDFLIYDGGSLVDTLVIADVLIQRYDQIWLGVSFDSTRVRGFATSGSREDGHPALGGYKGTISTAPTSVRFGSADYSEINDIACSMITQDDSKAATTVQGFMDLLGDYNLGRSGSGRVRLR
ncbi:unnamed protein product, partial [marine sediment metagenome]